MPRLDSALPSADPLDPNAPIEPVIAPEPDPPVAVPLAIEDWISVLTLAALALITCANVLVRYLTDQSFAWTEEISIFLLVVLTLVAGSTAFVRNQHIRIELFADNGSAVRQRRLALFARAAVLLFFMILTVLSARMAIDEFVYEETSPAIGVPTWWYTVWLPILSAAICLRLAGALRRIARNPA